MCYHQINSKSCIQLSYAEEKIINNLIASFIIVFFSKKTREK